ncbi:hypothetical protein AB0B25_17380, partial [Nocardia sp. NPDC049190]|uniref:WXG100-like domain-containing protein n=1 Tax=Nocardia sp. NPDC049190 TaxID=3155650 RepID=UPI0033C5324B
MGLELSEAGKWLLGMVGGAEWPEGIEKDMWQLAAFLRQAAADLAELVPDVANAKSIAVAAYPSGDGIEAMTVAFDGFADYIPKLVDQFEQLATQADDTGGSIETGKIQIISSLILLALELAASKLFPLTSPAVDAAAMGATRIALTRIAQWLLSRLAGAGVPRLAARLTVQLSGHALLGGAMGLGQDAGIQLWEIGHGHQSTGFDTTRALSSAAAGAAGGAAGGAFGKGLQKLSTTGWGLDHLTPQRMFAANVLGGGIVGGLAGWAGGGAVTGDWTFDYRMVSSGIIGAGTSMWGHQGFEHMAHRNPDGFFARFNNRVGPITKLGFALVPAEKRTTPIAPTSTPRTVDRALETPNPRPPTETGPQSSATDGRQHEQAASSPQARGDSVSAAQSGARVGVGTEQLGTASPVDAASAAVPGPAPADVAARQVATSEGPGTGSAADPPQVSEHTAAAHPTGPVGLAGVAGSAEDTPTRSQPTEARSPSSETRTSTNDLTSSRPAGLPGTGPADRSGPGAAARMMQPGIARPDFGSTADSSGAAGSAARAGAQPASSSGRAANVDAAQHHSAVPRQTADGPVGSDDLRPRQATAASPPVSSVPGRGSTSEVVSEVRTKAEAAKRSSGEGRHRGAEKAATTTPGYVGRRRLEGESAGGRHRGAEKAATTTPGYSGKHRNGEPETVRTDSADTSDTSVDAARTFEPRSHRGEEKEATTTPGYEGSRRSDEVMPLVDELRGLGIDPVGTEQVLRDAFRALKREGHVGTTYRKWLAQLSDSSFTYTVFGRRVVLDTPEAFTEAYEQAQARALDMRQPAYALMGALNSTMFDTPVDMTVEVLRLNVAAELEISDPHRLTAGGWRRAVAEVERQLREEGEQWPAMRETLSTRQQAVALQQYSRRVALFRRLVELVHGVPSTVPVPLLHSWQPVPGEDEEDLDEDALPAEHDDFDPLGRGRAGGAEPEISWEHSEFDAQTGSESGGRAPDPHARLESPEDEVAELNGHGRPADSGDWQRHREPIVRRTEPDDTYRLQTDWDVPWEQSGTSGAQSESDAPRAGNRGAADDERPWMTAQHEHAHKQALVEALERQDVQFFGHLAHTVPSEVLRDVVGAVEVLLERYPDVPLSSVRFESLNSDAPDGDFSGRASDVRLHPVHPRGWGAEIVLDPRILADPIELRARARVAVEDGDHLPLTGDPVRDSINRQLAEVLDIQGDRAAWETARPSLLELYRYLWSHGLTDLSFREWAGQLSGESFSRSWGRRQLNAEAALREAFAWVEAHGIDVTRPEYALYRALVSASTGAPWDTAADVRRVRVAAELGIAEPHRFTAAGWERELARLHRQLAAEGDEVRARMEVLGPHAAQAAAGLHLGRVEHYARLVELVHGDPIYADELPLDGFRDPTGAHADLSLPELRARNDCGPETLAALRAWFGPDVDVRVPRHVGLDGMSATEFQAAARGQLRAVDGDGSVAAQIEGMRSGAAMLVVEEYTGPVDAHGVGAHAYLVVNDNGVAKIRDRHGNLLPFPPPEGPRTVKGLYGIAYDHNGTPLHSLGEDRMPPVLPGEGPQSRIGGEPWEGPGGTRDGPIAAGVPRTDTDLQAWGRAGGGTGPEGESSDPRDPFNEALFNDLTPVGNDADTGGGGGDPPPRFSRGEFDDDGPTALDRDLAAHAMARLSGERTAHAPGSREDVAQRLLPLDYSEFLESTMNEDELVGHARTQAARNRAWWRGLTDDGLPQQLRERIALERGAAPSVFGLTRLQRAVLRVHPDLMARAVGIPDDVCNQASLRTLVTHLRELTDKAVTTELSYAEVKQGMLIRGLIGSITFDPGVASHFVRDVDPHTGEVAFVFGDASTAAKRMYIVGTHPDPLMTSDYQQNWGLARRVYEVMQRMQHGAGVAVVAWMRGVPGAGEVWTEAQRAALLRRDIAAADAANAVDGVVGSAIDLVTFEGAADAAFTSSGLSFRLTEIEGLHTVLLVDPVNVDLNDASAPDVSVYAVVSQIAPDTQNLPSGARRLAAVDGIDRTDLLLFERRDALARMIARIGLGHDVSKYVSGAEERFGALASDVEDCLPAGNRTLLDLGADDVFRLRVGEVDWRALEGSVGGRLVPVSARDPHSGETGLVEQIIDDLRVGRARDERGEVIPDSVADSLTVVLDDGAAAHRVEMTKVGGEIIVFDPLTGGPLEVGRWREIQPFRDVGKAWVIAHRVGQDGVLRPIDSTLHRRDVDHPDMPAHPIRGGLDPAGASRDVRLPGWFWAEPRTLAFPEQALRLLLRDAGLVGDDAWEAKKSAFEEMFERVELPGAGLGFDERFLREDISVTAVREIARAVGDLMTAHPGAGLDSFYVAEYPDTLPDDVPARTEVIRLPDGSEVLTIAFNRAWLADPVRFAEFWADAVEDGTFLPGSGNPWFDMVAHEFGHLLAYRSGAVGEAALITQWESALPAAHRQLVARGMAPLSFAEWTATLSGYSRMPGGSINPQEALAEAFARTVVHGRDWTSPHEVLYRLLNGELWTIDDIVRRVAGQPPDSTDDSGAQEHASPAPDGARDSAGPSDLSHAISPAVVRNMGFIDRLILADASGIDAVEPVRAGDGDVHDDGRVSPLRVEQITYRNGEVVTRTYVRTESQARAMYAASLVAHVAGARVGAVYLEPGAVAFGADSAYVVYTEHVDGLPGQEWGMSSTPRTSRQERVWAWPYVDTADGRRLGVLDALVGNPSLGRQWQVGADFGVHGSGHWSTFAQRGEPGAFERRVRAISRLFGIEGIDPVASIDFREIRRRLHELRPEFERIRAADWHDQLMRRLDEFDHDAVDLTRVGREPDGPVSCALAGGRLRELTADLAKQIEWTRMERNSWSRIDPVSPAGNPLHLDGIPDDGHDGELVRRAVNDFYYEWERPLDWATLEHAPAQPFGAGADAYAAIAARLLGAEQGESYRQVDDETRRRNHGRGMVVTESSGRRYLVVNDSGELVVIDYAGRFIGEFEPAAAAPHARSVTGIELTKWGGLAQPPPPDQGSSRDSPLRPHQDPADGVPVRELPADYDHSTAVRAKRDLLAGMAQRHGMALHDVVRAGFLDPHVPVSVVEDFGRALDRLRRRFPQVGLARIGILEFSDFRYAQTNRVPLPSGGYGAEITLNAVWARNPEAWATAMAADIEAGWALPKTGNPVLDTLAHMFGYALDLSRDGIVAAEVEHVLRRTHLELRDAGLIDLSYSKWVGQLPSHSFEQGWKLLRRRLSAHEALADAFAYIAANGLDPLRPEYALYRLATGDVALPRIDEVKLLVERNSLAAELGIDHPSRLNRAAWDAAIGRIDDELARQGGDLIHRVDDAGARDEVADYAQRASKLDQLRRTVEFERAVRPVIKELAQRDLQVGEGFFDPEVSVDTIREFAQAVMYLRDRFPDVAPPVIAIEPLANAKTIGMVDVEILGASRVGAKIVLARHLAVDPEFFAERKALNVETGFLQAGTGRPVFDTVVHEFGHVIGRQTELPTREQAQRILDDTYVGLAAAGVVQTGYDTWIRQLAGYSFVDGDPAKGINWGEASAEALVYLVARGRDWSTPQDAVYRAWIGDDTPVDPDKVWRNRLAQKLGVPRPARLDQAEWNTVPVALHDEVAAQRRSVVLQLHTADRHDTRAALADNASRWEMLAQLTGLVDPQQRPAPPQPVSSASGIEDLIRQRPGGNEWGAEAVFYPQQRRLVIVAVDDRHSAVLHRLIGSHWPQLEAQAHYGLEVEFLRAVPDETGTRVTLEQVDIVRADPDPGRILAHPVGGVDDAARTEDARYRARGDAADVEAFGVDHPAVPVEVVQDLHRAIAFLRDRFPDVVMPRFGIDVLANPDPLAQVRRGGTGELEVTLDLRSVADPQRLTAGYQQQVADGRLHPGTGNPVFDAVVGTFAQVLDHHSGPASHADIDAALRDTHHQLRAGGLITLAYDEWIGQLPGAAFTEGVRDINPERALAASLEYVLLGEPDMTRPEYSLYRVLVGDTGPLPVDDLAPLAERATLARELGVDLPWRLDRSAWEDTVTRLHDEQAGWDRAFFERLNAPADEAIRTLWRERLTRKTHLARLTDLVRGVAEPSPVEVAEREDAMRSALAALRERGGQQWADTVVYLPAERRLVVLAGGSHLQALMRLRMRNPELFAQAALTGYVVDFRQLTNSATAGTENTDLVHSWSVQASPGAVAKAQLVTELEARGVDTIGFEHPDVPIGVARDFTHAVTQLASEFPAGRVRVRIGDLPEGSDPDTVTVTHRVRESRWRRPITEIVFNSRWASDPAGLATVYSALVADGWLVSAGRGAVFESAVRAWGEAIEIRAGTWKFPRSTSTPVLHAVLVDTHRQLTEAGLVRMSFDEWTRQMSGAGFAAESGAIDLSAAAAEAFVYVRTRGADWTRPEYALYRGLVGDRAPMDMSQVARDVERNRLAEKLGVAQPAGLDATGWHGTLDRLRQDLISERRDLLSVSSDTVSPAMIADHLIRVDAVRRLTELVRPGEVPVPQASLVPTQVRDDPAPDGALARARAFADRIDAAIATGEVEVEPLRGGRHRVERVTYADGTVVVRKQFGDRLLDAHAEYLAALVGMATRAKVPAVVLGEGFVYVEYIEGQTGKQLLRSGFHPFLDVWPYTDTVDGRRLGRLDALVGNLDRRYAHGNWMTDERHLWGIDHEMTYRQERSNSNFAGRARDNIARFGLRWLDPLDPADGVTSLRSELESLRTEFERLDRGDWHAQTIQQLSELERGARDVGRARVDLALGLSQARDRVVSVLREALDATEYPGATQLELRRALGSVGHPHDPLSQWLLRPYDTLVELRAGGVPADILHQVGAALVDHGRVLQQVRRAAEDGASTMKEVADREADLIKWRRLLRDQGVRVGLAPSPDNPATLPHLPGDALCDPLARLAANDYYFAKRAGLPVFEMPSEAVDLGGSPRTALGWAARARYDAIGGDERAHAAIAARLLGAVDGQTYLEVDEQTRQANSGRGMVVVDTHHADPDDPTPAHSYFVVNHDGELLMIDFGNRSITEFDPAHAPSGLRDVRVVELADNGDPVHPLVDDLDAEPDSPPAKRQPRPPDGNIGRLPGESENYRHTSESARDDGPVPDPSWFADRVREALDSGEPTVEVLTEGHTRDQAQRVEKLTFPDETVLIRKYVHQTRHADAEYLASRTGAALGARVPAVHIENGVVYMEYVVGRTGLDLYTDIPVESRMQLGQAGIHASTTEGRWLGLVDLLVGNQDRLNNKNWMVHPDAGVYGIDHSQSFHDATNSIFGKQLRKFLGQFGIRWLDSDLPDFGPIHARLDALWPEFDRLGRGDWHYDMVGRLAELEDLATDKVRLRWEYDLARAQAHEEGDEQAHRDLDAMIRRADRTWAKQMQITADEQAAAVKAARRAGQLGIPLGPLHRPNNPLEGAHDPGDAACGLLAGQAANDYYYGVRRGERVFDMPAVALDADGLPWAALPWQVGGHLEFFGHGAAGHEAVAARLLGAAAGASARNVSESTRLKNSGRGMLLVDTRRADGSPTPAHSYFVVNHDGELLLFDYGGRFIGEFDPEKPLPGLLYTHGVELDVSGNPVRPTVTDLDTELPAPKPDEPRGRQLGNVGRLPDPEEASRQPTSSHDTDGPSSSRAADTPSGGVWGAPPHDPRPPPAPVTQGQGGWLKEDKNRS